jgi:dTDP-4-amino-4,6-dideoxygalactose transaminase
MIFSSSEDAAQATGAEYIFSVRNKKEGRTIGIVGTTSFFPSKNLDAMADGGALYTMIVIGKKNQKLSQPWDEGQIFIMTI